MLYHILYPLKDVFTGFNIFRYITIRASFAAVFAFIITVWIIPRLIRWSESHSLKERISEDVPERHRVKEGTPSSGGIAFIIGVIVSVLLFERLDVSFTWMALFVTVYLGLMGFADDKIKLLGQKKKGMSKRDKIIFQSLLTLIVFLFVLWKYPADMKLSTQSLIFKHLVVEMWIFYPIFLFFVLVGTTNAVNITDGLDGLAAGASLPVLGTFIAVAYIEGHAKFADYLHLLHIPGIGEIAIFGSAFLGALLGFLWFNAHPAEIFMGDTGSQSLGGALAIMSILTKQELLLAIAGGLFVIEMTSVIIQIVYFRKTGGKRFFLKAPLHHHFEMKGWAEPKIVVRFWILSLIFSLIALSTLKVR